MMLRVVVKDIDKKTPEGDIKIFKIVVIQIFRFKSKKFSKNGFVSANVYYPASAIQKISSFEASEGRAGG